MTSTHYTSIHPFGKIVIHLIKETTTEYMGVVTEIENPKYERFIGDKVYWLKDIIDLKRYVETTIPLIL
jgi:hypothetical protein